MNSTFDKNDDAVIDSLIADFYAAFDNRGGRAVPMDQLRDMFLPHAVIV